MYLAPSLGGYLAFLYDVVEIPPEFLPSVTSTATGGSTTQLTDTSQTWVVNQWAGYVLNDGSLVAAIVSNTATTLTFSALPQPVNAGDFYTVTPPVVGGSLSVAQSVVNHYLCATGMYTYAVYNLAADRLVNYAPDVKGQTFFKDKRCAFKIDAVSLWITSGASDQGTSQQGMIPKQFEHFTLGDLQNLKTPWGRAYIEIAQSVGSLWGVS